MAEKEEIVSNKKIKIEEGYLYTIGNNGYVYKMPVANNPEGKKYKIEGIKITKNPNYYYSVNEKGYIIREKYNKYKQPENEEEDEIENPIEKSEEEDNQIEKLGETKIEDNKKLMEKQVDNPKDYRIKNHYFSNLFSNIKNTSNPNENIFNSLFYLKQIKGLKQLEPFHCEICNKVYPLVLDESDLKHLKEKNYLIIWDKEKQHKDFSIDKIFDNIEYIYNRIVIPMKKWNISYQEKKNLEKNEKYVKKNIIIICNEDYEKIKDKDSFAMKILKALNLKPKDD